MQANVLSTVLLPLALGIIMYGLGLALTREDFRRVLVYPRAVLIGLFCQTVLLPPVCLLLAHAFGLPPELAVGLMLLAATPGGATANLFSHLARGDVALNITLTAVNSLLALVTLPLIVNLSFVHFLGEGRELPMPFGKVLQVFAIVLVPVALGMWTRARSPALASRLDRPFRAASIAFLVLIILATAWGERAMISEHFRSVGLAALAFNLASLSLGYLVPRLARLPQRQAVAMGMEVGIHNGTLAMALALTPTLLNNPTLAIPAAVYSVIMFVTAGLFGVWASRRAEAAEARPAGTPG
jgi:BASS family bile acid:Na+ symporter